MTKAKRESLVQAVTIRFHRLEGVSMVGMSERLKEVLIKRLDTHIAEHHQLMCGELRTFVRRHADELVSEAPGCSKLSLSAAIVNSLVRGTLLAIMNELAQAGEVELANVDPAVGTMYSDQPGVVYLPQDERDRADRLLKRAGP